MESWDILACVDESTYFPSSSVLPLVRISALPSTVGIIFFHCDPRNGITCHEGTAGEQRHSCTLSLTSAIEGVGGQRHAPSALPSGMTRHSLYRRLGGTQERSGRVRKISPPTGIRFPDRPTCSASLYRLIYPGPQIRSIITIYSEGNTRTSLTAWVRNTSQNCYAAWHDLFCTWLLRMLNILCTEWRKSHLTLYC